MIHQPTTSEKINPSEILKNEKCKEEKVNLLRISMKISECVEVTKSEDKEKDHLLLNQ